MDNRNRENKKKGSPAGLAVVAIAAAVSLLQNVVGGRDFFMGLLILAAVAAVIVAAVIIGKKKLAQARDVRDIFAHSHDRLNKSASGDDCPVDAHWKVQLDGFLKAGIIDRAEYQVLLQRHAVQYAKTQQ